MEYSKQYSKQYRKDHKEKHICDCGVEYIYTNKSHHIKSQRHLKYQDLQHKIQKQTDEIKIEPEHYDKLDEIFLAPIVLYALEPCQMSDLHMCSCGALCSLNSRFWHLKTKRHLEPQIIEEQDEIIPIQLEISKKAHLLEKNRIYAKMYREKNSDKLKELHTCICGGTFTMMNKGRHMNSKSHMKCLVIENEAI
jgi:hypothetical protein